MCVKKDRNYSGPLLEVTKRKTTLVSTKYGKGTTVNNTFNLYNNNNNNNNNNNDDDDNNFGMKEGVEEKIWSKM